MLTIFINNKERLRNQSSYIYEETIERRGALVYLNYTHKVEKYKLHIEMKMIITSVNEVRGDKL
jgi:hypothetical protein